MHAAAAPAPLLLDPLLPAAMLLPRRALLIAVGAAAALLASAGGRATAFVAAPLKMSAGRGERALQQQRVAELQQKKKKAATEAPTANKTFFSGVLECPECQGDVITHDGPRTKRCNVCFHEWV